VASVWRISSLRLGASYASTLRASVSRMKISELRSEGSNCQEQVFSLGIGGDTESSIGVNEGEPNSPSLSVTYKASFLRFSPKTVRVS